MLIEKIWLKDFRNFSNQIFDFSRQTTLIFGPNASGKTNILEAIDLLAEGKSFKAEKNEQMISHNSQLARAKAKFSQDLTLEVVLTRGSVKEGNVAKKTAKKKLLVNGVAKRLLDFSSHFQTVVFRPQDLDLVTSSPALRRRFLDRILALVDREYYRSLISYQKGLRRRNKVLFRIREGELGRQSLTFWDSLLIKNGNYISSKRIDFLDFVNLQDSLEEKEIILDYDMSAISESRLKEYQDREIAAAKTLVGPHRDDFSFNLEGRDLASFGSRGEQRMAVLWLKLSEMEFIQEKKDERPVLLLDDIFSELDIGHRKIIEEVIERQQTIITTADLHYAKRLKAANLLKIKS